MRYNPLRASSFIELPKSIKDKHACINVQNNDDNKCFLWAVLSAEKNINPKDHPYRVEHYTPFESTLNMDGIPTPVPISSIPRFERLNNRSINVYALRWNNTLKKHDVDPIYISSAKQPQHVNLLYISNNQGQSHYVWIKDLSRLVHGQASLHHGKHFICERCLHGSSSQRTLDIHELKCQEYRAQRTVFPEADTKLQFEKIAHQHPVEFFIVADLESSLEPYSTTLPEPTHSSTTPIARHVPNSAAYKVVSTDPRFYQPVREFKGENCVEHFIDALQDDAQKITKILDINVPHSIPEDERKSMINSATECYLCKGPPSDKDYFVLDHSHTDGTVRGIAHNSCNVNFKTSKTQINVFLHNAKSYDAHLILSHANPSKHGKVSCIPRTTEQYVSFQIGNLIFKDSMQFMNKSLDNLVSTLDKSQLHITSEFVKNYVKNISDTPELLEDPTLGLYHPEIPGVTFEIAKLKKKNKKRKLTESNEEPRAPKRARCNFVDDEVEVENDIEDDILFEAETESDCEFIDDDDDNIDDGSLHRAFNQQNPVRNESDTELIYPPNDYRRNPYTSPELTEVETELYNVLFDLISSKGVYFYEYVSSASILEETTLPSQEEFYSHLTGESITDVEYARAKDVWEKFQMKSLWNYHDLYLITDVLLLADVILNFQKVCRDNYGIDPLHSYTTPGFGWQSLLKMTGVELELFSEEQKELYLFFEAAKRGGLSTISKRHIKANIPERTDYDPSKPNKWIMYWDANNLYVSFL